MGGAVITKSYRAMRNKRAGPGIGANFISSDVSGSSGTAGCRNAACPDAATFTPSWRSKTPSGH
jgi:hypothetical protein